MESLNSVSNTITTFFSISDDGRILVSIYLVFPIILIFFFLSLRDLERLENQEKYDMTHSHYQPNIYNNLVTQWTKQGIQNLKNDERYIQWQQQKERESAQLSQESSKLSFRQQQQ